MSVDDRFRCVCTGVPSARGGERMRDASHVALGAPEVGGSGRARGVGSRRGRYTRALALWLRLGAPQGARGCGRAPNRARVGRLLAEGSLEGRVARRRFGDPSSSQEASSHVATRLELRHASSGKASRRLKSSRGFRCEAGRFSYALLGHGRRNRSSGALGEGLRSRAVPIHVERLAALIQTTPGPSRMRLAVRRARRR